MAVEWKQVAYVGEPGTHAATHEDGGSDELTLDALGEPLAAVEFDGQQAQNLVVHTVADEAARLALTPVVGKMAFQSDELAIYICTSAA